MLTTSCVLVSKLVILTLLLPCRCSGIHRLHARSGIRWGSTIQDFALVFSFWTRWTQKQCPEAVKIHTWTQALALFVRYGGASADFLQQCQFVGMAAYKLRVLSNFMFQTQKQNDELNSLNFSNHSRDKWLESFPSETAFPDDLFFTSKWDLIGSNGEASSVAR